VGDACFDEIEKGREIAGNKGVTLSREHESDGDGAGERESSNSRWLWLVLMGIGLAIATAFRLILIAPFGLIAPAEFEYWFFIPNRDSGAISLLVAAWFLWNRRRRFAASRKQGIGWAHWAAAFVVLLFFLWAVWTRTQALLIPALCVTLAILASAWGGRSAFRLVGMPCIALMLAFPPPPPMQAEIIWRLQGLTAGGADLLLTLAGYSVQLEGTELRFGGHAFVIIEACSGWRGIQILALVGLAASELRTIPLRRAVWVILSAVPLGIGLNVLRTSLVMLTQEELKLDFFESHTPQGIAVLLLGSVILYGIASFLARESKYKPGTPSTGAQSVGIVQHSGQFVNWTVFSLAFPLALALVSLVAPHSPEPAEQRGPHAFRFPTELPPWSGTKLDLDYFFPYSTPTNPQFHAEYRNPEAPGGTELVDLFIARETPMSSGLDRMPNAKLLLPASDWSLISRESARVWQFGIDAEEAIASREAGSMLSYVLAWRVRDEGLIRESLRSLMGLQGCRRSHSQCTRIVFRIAVPIFHDDDRGRERARMTADRFIDDFIFPLKVKSIR
jgi:exosortase